MKILVTGGAGYIGSHTCVELLEAGHEVVVIDNLCNSSRVSLDRVATLTGRTVSFVEGDIRDPAALLPILERGDVDAVIHFAGLKAVGESVEIPLSYYQNNITGTLALLEGMVETGVKRLVFSSSATVYGDPDSLPITEDFPLSASNPYGRSKLVIEEMLRDIQAADEAWNISILRYFNPVGAHESGLIGEDPRGIPNNLMPYIAQVAAGRLEQLSVFGGDYPTPDGTGVRDYIHVVDLARGHLAALERLQGNPGLMVHNLGTGKGYSVLEMIRAFESASNRPVAYRVVDRRPGDIAACYADPGLAFRELGWRAERGLEQMCQDTWRWQSSNPQGYGD
ncbi:UDP-glucose 4-epimerase GalE [Sedimenticola thiotaurini]|uniref:UDP-glucose 4-epimerase n=1 Tax=Sedimenticola thiotaurini TaxID=1543721 RepID=A0A0F7JWH2_9GAMM|nr:UDP-glucose 4-epimerase GalE [Sedimenticola thiotaurini]AKH19729.1 UDP-galactose-4-epimerase [Sedimenticola thiotaurini]